MRQVRCFHGAFIVHIVDRSSQVVASWFLMLCFLSHTLYMRERDVWVTLFGPFFGSRPPRECPTRRGPSQEATLAWTSTKVPPLRGHTYSIHRLTDTTVYCVGCVDITVPNAYR